MSAIDEESPFTATADGARQASYSELARRGPLHRIRLAGAEAWLVTGLDECRALLTDARVRKGGPEGRATSAFGAGMSEAVERGLYSHMLTADPPEHTRLRRLVGQAFSRGRMSRLEPQIRATADELLDRLPTTSPVDLISTYAYPFPMAVIADLIGIPPDARTDVQGWATPMMSPGLVPESEIAEAAERLHAFARDLVEEKRRAPQDDLLSDLITASADGARLTEDELTSMVYLLVFAGHETTVNLIGNGVAGLLRNPAQLSALRADPEALPAAVEELLRWDPPVQSTLPYLVSEPVAVAGETIQPGEPIIFSLMGAARDPGHVEEPDRLDVSRRSPAHISFGFGVHHCLGAPLARMEGVIGIGRLFNRFPGIRLADDDAEHRRKPSMVLNAYEVLTVRLDPEGV